MLYKVYDGGECAGEWRHADVRSCTDIASLSEYEQPLSISERDAGCVTPTRTSRRRRRGCAGSGVTLSQCRTWTRSRYQNTNNRYQSANVAAGLSCQRDADMSVTNTTARVCGEWRRADMRSNVDTMPLLDYEQPLSISERDTGCVTPTRTSRTRRHRCAGRGVTLSQRRMQTRSRYRNTNNRYQSANMAAGLSCQRDADGNVTDTAARVRQGLKKDLTFSCIAIIFLLNPIWNYTVIRFSVTERR